MMKISNTHEPVSTKGAAPLTVRPSQASKWVLCSTPAACSVVCAGEWLFQQHM